MLNRFIRRINFAGRRDTVDRVGKIREILTALMRARPAAHRSPTFFMFICIEKGRAVRGEKGNK